MTMHPPLKRKRNIEWSNRSWNWTTGCNGPEGVHCPGCYAKSMAQRLRGRYGYPEDDPFRVVLHPDKLHASYGHKDHPDNAKGPRIYFNVSMGDWMDREVKPDWRQTACTIMEKHPEHIFVTLTKQYCELYKIPHYFTDEIIPPNVWVGISVMNKSQVWGMNKLARLEAPVKFVSFEPLMEDLSFISLEGLQWIILGGRTPHGGESRFIPPTTWIAKFFSKAKGIDTGALPLEGWYKEGVPVFLKPNLGEETMKMFETTAEFYDLSLEDLTQQMPLPEVMV